MPSFNSSYIPTLHLLPSLPTDSSLSDDVGHRSYPTERQINRYALLEIAPDRETLLVGPKSIEEIRQALKIRIKPGEKQSHWLYQYRLHEQPVKTNITKKTKSRDPAARISVFLRPSNGTVADGGAPNEKTAATSTTLTRTPSVRRVLSASSLHPRSAPYPLTASIGNQLQVLRTWEQPRLSTPDKLVSPRPLVATHLLVISAPGLEHVELELPINDLLFAISVPNLVLASPVSPSHLQSSFSSPAALSCLPHRRPGVLPRVRLVLPHLRSARALIAFLHTRNHAELFRRILPEWVRDVLHPLPFPASGNTNDNTASSAPVIKRKKSQVFRRVSREALRAASMSPPPPLPGTSLSLNRSLVAPPRTLDSIARELAEVASHLADNATPRIESIDLQTSAVVSFDDPDSAAEAPLDAQLALVSACARLDALAANLAALGAWPREVCTELDTSRDVLLRAMACHARAQGLDVSNSDVS